MYVDWTMKVLYIVGVLDKSNWEYLLILDKVFLLLVILSKLYLEIITPVLRMKKALLPVGVMMKMDGWMFLLTLFFMISILVRNMDVGWISWVN